MVDSVLRAGEGAATVRPRELLIVVIAVLVVFGAAFGIAKAGGDDSKASAELKPAEVIEVGEAAVSARVADNGGLPALRLPEKTPEATPDATDDPPASTTGPVATSTPPPTTTTSPSSSGGGTTEPSTGDSSISGGGD